MYVFVVKRFTDDTAEQDKLEIKVTAISCWGEVCRGAMGIQKREISSRLEAGGPSWRHSVGELHLERLVGVS